MGDIGRIGRIVMTQAGVLVSLGVGILVLVRATTLARGDALIAWERSCLTQPGISLGFPEAC